MSIPIAERKQGSAPPAPPAGNVAQLTAPEPCWTTGDEVAFVQHLARRNPAALRKYARVLPYRHFAGRGMRVDRAAVSLALETALERPREPRAA